VCSTKRQAVSVKCREQRNRKQAHFRASARSRDFRFKEPGAHTALCQPRLPTERAMTQDISQALDRMPDTIPRKLERAGSRESFLVQQIPTTSLTAWAYSRHPNRFTNFSTIERDFKLHARSCKKPSSDRATPITERRFESTLRLTCVC